MGREGWAVASRGQCGGSHWDSMGMPSTSSEPVPLEPLVPGVGAGGWGCGSPWPGQGLRLGLPVPGGCQCLVDADQGALSTLLLDSSVATSCSKGTCLSERDVGGLLCLPRSGSLERVDAGWT